MALIDTIPRQPVARLTSALTLALLTAVALTAATPAAADVLARWTQYVADGGAEARAVVTDPACPEATVDGIAVAMTERAAPDGAFPERVCALALSGGATSVTVAGVAVPAPAKTIGRVLIVGDTGCRVAPNWAQACDDPTKWVFATVAAAGAAEKPDLIIHVGDYIYRERPCPTLIQPGCAGTPSGDNWATWAADFFTPAAPLLAAAPMIVVRGNHEICSRAGVGYSRHLSPDVYDPAMPCPQKDPTYTVAIDGQSFAVLDTSYPPDARVDPAMAAILRQELDAIGTAAESAPTMLLTHKPAWAITRGAHDRVYGSSQTYAAAAGDSLPSALQVAISGHIHLFESLTFTNGGPGQLVVGNSGTMLERPVPSDLSGMKAAERTVADGLEIHAFGFMVMERTPDGWTGRVLDETSALLATCDVVPGPLACRLTP
jgi:predicted phosphodiesterase